MNIDDSNKKSTVARHNGFIFNRINKLTINFYSHLRYKNIISYLKFQIPMCHRQFFRVISQNRADAESFCINMENSFHFQCRKWFNQLN